jgi:uncharacterized protein YceK
LLLSKRMKAIAVFCLLGLTGCSTVSSMNLLGPRIYSGVRYDAESLLCDDDIPNLVPYPWTIPYVLFDLPLSLALDTIFLPFTFVHVVTRGEYRPHRGTADPPPLSRIEGVILASDSAGFEVVEAGAELQSEDPPIRSAQIRVFARMDADPEVLCLSWSEDLGRFTLGGSRKFPWETLQVECRGHAPLAFSGSELHSPYDREYWKAHRLVIRMVRR